MKTKNLDKAIKNLNIILKYQDPGTAWSRVNVDFLRNIITNLERHKVKLTKAHSQTAKSSSKE